MREKILALLLAREGEFVSGEELSKVLGISRAGVWKHISHLREEGYRIESQTRLGHRLARNSGPLNKYVLGHNLGTAKIGREFVVRHEVSSTNEVAKELARAGAEDGTAVVAETQSGGRGRRGRQWLSPQGGIWLSVILRPGVGLKDVASYTLLTGVAVAAAINKVTGLKAGIKWPNDILIRDKKVGGILAEVFGEWQAVDFLVIGIGVNANLGEQDLPPGVMATSLALEAGQPVLPVELIQNILRELERLEQLLLAGKLSEVLAEWRSLAVCLNCTVVVKEHKEEWPAESVDIAADGALIVKTADNRLVKLYSGEVSLRGPSGDYHFN